MLFGDWWITPFGAWQMGGSEHAQFAASVMLSRPGEGPGAHVPLHWIVKGIPENKLLEALEQGADPRAIEFLHSPKADPRLWALREYGWIRVARNFVNVWLFTQELAEIYRGASEYWKYQEPHVNCGEMIDIMEYSTQDRYAVSLEKILNGADPQVLKHSQMGQLEHELVHEAPVRVPVRTRLGELQRKRLAGITGDNPPRKGRYYS